MLRVPCKIYPDFYRVQPEIFIGCHLRFFRVESTQIFFQGAHLIFFGFISMTPNFFQAATLNKIRVEATLSQVAPYKNLDRFYRVPFKSLFRVQIKWANEPTKMCTILRNKGVEKLDFQKWFCSSVRICAFT